MYRSVPKGGEHHETKEDFLSSALVPIRCGHSRHACQSSRDIWLDIRNGHHAGHWTVRNNYSRKFLYDYGRQLHSGLWRHRFL